MISLLKVAQFTCLHCNGDVFTVTAYQSWIARVIVTMIAPGAAGDWIMIIVNAFSVSVRYSFYVNFAQ